MWELVNLPGWSPAEPAQTKSDTSDNNSRAWASGQHATYRTRNPAHTGPQTSPVSFPGRIDWEKMPRSFSFLSNGRAETSTKRPTGCREVREEEVHRTRGSWRHFCFMSSRSTLEPRFALWHFHRIDRVEVSVNLAASSSCRWRRGVYLWGDCSSSTGPVVSAGR